MSLQMLSNESKSEVISSDIITGEVANGSIAVETEELNSTSNYELEKKFRTEAENYAALLHVEYKELLVRHAAVESTLDSLKVDMARSPVSIHQHAQNEHEDFCRESIKMSLLFRIAGFEDRVDSLDSLSMKKRRETCLKIKDDLSRLLADYKEACLEFFQFDQDENIQMHLDQLHEKVFFMCSRTELDKDKNSLSETEEQKQTRLSFSNDDLNVSLNSDKSPAMMNMSVNDQDLNLGNFEDASQIQLQMNKEESFGSSLLQSVNEVDNISSGVLSNKSQECDVLTDCSKLTKYLCVTPSHEISQSYNDEKLGISPRNACCTENNSKPHWQCESSLTEVVSYKSPSDHDDLGIKLVDVDSKELMQSYLHSLEQYCNIVDSESCIDNNNFHNNDITSESVKMATLSGSTSPMQSNQYGELDSGFGHSEGSGGGIMWSGGKISPISSSTGVNNSPRLLHHEEASNLVATLNSKLGCMPSSDIAKEQRNVMTDDVSNSVPVSLDTKSEMDLMWNEIRELRAELAHQRSASMEHLCSVAGSSSHTLVNVEDSHLSTTNAYPNSTTGFILPINLREAGNVLATPDKYMDKCNARNYYGPNGDKLAQCKIHDNAVNVSMNLKRPHRGHCRSQSLTEMDWKKTLDADHIKMGDKKKGTIPHVVSEYALPHNGCSIQQSSSCQKNLASANSSLQRSDSSKLVPDGLGIQKPKFRTSSFTFPVKPRWKQTQSSYNHIPGMPVKATHALGSRHHQDSIHHSNSDVNPSSAKHYFSNKPTCQVCNKSHSIQNVGRCSPFQLTHAPVENFQQCSSQSQYDCLPSRSTHVFAQADIDTVGSREDKQARCKCFYCHSNWNDKICHVCRLCRAPESHSAEHHKMCRGGPENDNHNKDCVLQCCNIPVIISNPPTPEIRAQFFGDAELNYASAFCRNRPSCVDLRNSLRSHGNLEAACERDSFYTGKDNLTKDKDNVRNGIDQIVINQRCKRCKRYGSDVDLSIVNYECERCKKYGAFSSSPKPHSNRASPSLSHTSSSTCSLDSPKKTHNSLRKKTAKICRRKSLSKSVEKLSLDVDLALERARQVQQSSLEMLNKLCLD